MKRVTIAGGGIAGLSIAWAIRQRAADVDVVVLERAARVGGNIRTEQLDGYTCEFGPDGFLDNAPDTLRLVGELGLQSRLLPSNDAARRRFIFRKGRLHRVPSSPWQALSTSLLSTRGKLRLVLEPFVSAASEEDESIRDFAARRIGPEAANVLVDSMVSGIFAGDSSALSLRSCFPRLWRLERDHGSLSRALLATRRQRKKSDAPGAPAGRLTSFRGGMTELPDALARQLGASVRTSAPVLRLHTAERSSTADAGSGGRYVVSTSDRGPLQADAVVLAGSAAESASILRGFDPHMAGLLEDVPTAPLAVVCLGYDADALARERPLDGFGFLVPRGEGVRILGALWETSIYPERAPAGKALLRVMIGGARDRDAVSLDDPALARTVRGNLATTMGLSIAPEFVHIVRHARGIPQYVKGHHARLQRIEPLLQRHPGLHLAGSSYQGASINACIAAAGGIAQRILTQLTATAGEGALV